MTSLKSSPVQSAAVSAPPRSRRKGVLFCPSCGHESPLTGDWLLDRADDARRYRCPDCQTVVTDRAAESED
jgi:predicted RNA-binding Zn-ribbon protein involved in translation (DUF1610 family)